MSLFNLSNEKKKLFLCKWNGEEILEIHTFDSFFEQYKDTNVFDDDFVEDWNETIEQIFDRLEIDEREILDNMFIQRIK